ncbi:MAG: zf-HC2 domain-containing protein [Longimicrobiales bacterium]
MTERIECRVFEERLDALARGTLPPDLAVELRAHAAGCAACRGLAALGDHLAGPDLATLESRVPDAWIDGMWDSVQTALADEAPLRTSRRSLRVPLLAAAVVALLVATGWSITAWSRAERRSTALASELADQRIRLAELEARLDDAVAPGAATAAGGWLRSLDGADELTLDGLRAALADLPPGTPLLSAAKARALASSRWMPGPWRASLEHLPVDEPVTAADLLNALDELDLPGGMPVPADRLLDLLS